jgi:hypothetical protein
MRRRGTIALSVAEGQAARVGLTTGETMIEVERIGFCDEVRGRSDDKLDLIGYNTGRKIVAPLVPFVYRSTILVQGFIEGGTAAAEVVIVIERDNPKGERAEEILPSITIPHAGEAGMSLCLTWPVVLQINQFGTIRIRLMLNGEDAHSMLFSVVQHNQPRNYTSRGQE